MGYIGRKAENVTALLNFFMLVHCLRDRLSFQQKSAWRARRMAPGTRA